MSETRPTIARGFWTVAPGRGELRECVLDPPGPDQVRVRTRYSGISRGSESLVFHGRVPESEYRRMRAPFQRGEFPFPVQYGYACVGEVEAGPDRLLGRTVFCLHPHQDRFVVPAEAVHVLPEGVPAGRAVLAANAETALNALWDAQAGPGDRITVVGGGVVGLLVTRLAAQLPGAELTLIDVDPARRAVAERLGATFALPDEAPTDQDLVFHASATAEGLQTALNAAGFEAEIIELSWYGEGRTPVALGGAFHARRLTLRASQVGRVPARRRARWTPRRRLAAALALLADDALDALIDDECTFDALPARMPGLANAQAAGLCLRVAYPDRHAD
ncbi:zinc-binding alcohol dehydrogenase [Wenzhouxiangella sp. XN79A]|uniref:zinc-dependent alcohol dehydrogenase n=1 Tax=Wenzhouxiangella sp. XN79A TaxID=2724193 RepID=UPI00144A8319|nr:zinc-binding alcohol dehydrogenase [Wenzhouxiangella sp. XN79A]NKI33975.1 zinc-binding alcohol dehydrogenase [Wenzhouxiangella sp. XN79A]